MRTASTDIADHRWIGGRKYTPMDEIPEFESKEDFKLLAGAIRRFSKVSVRVITIPESREYAERYGIYVPFEDYEKVMEGLNAMRHDSKQTKRG